MSEFLFEIGAEEIPSGYIRHAVEALEESVTKKLDEWGVRRGEVKAYATPRRLAVSVTGLPQSRSSRKTKVYGPPAKAAFSASGAPTKAAEGFAKGRGVDVSALKAEKTDKGEYVYVEVDEGGERMADLLSEAMPAIALALPFPKSMTWGDCATRFTRPIHWVVALFDGEVLPMKLGGVESSNVTRGHRFLGSKNIQVKNIAGYLENLRQNYVIADIAERKKKVTENAEAAASSAGAKLLNDDELAETVAFLTEWPVALWGSFDEEFLALPEELLIASMKNHQRMFAAKGADGKLTNGFVGVSNMVTKDDGVVVAGYRRVLRARLSDAKFFFDEDRKHTLDHFSDKLGGVIYQKKLGTIGEKVGRVTKLAEHMAEKIAPDKKPLVSRAARLCKADLETLMVYEFPELQGVMGREYARHMGEPEEVAAAIYESYLPRYAGDSVPGSDVGACVGLADRIDTITGCFGVGLEPTGASDPFALRRNTLGVIQIILNRGYSLPLGDLLDFALGGLEDRLEAPREDVAGRVKSFFEGRLKNFWMAGGVPYDVADAVLAAGFDDMADANMRAQAMAELKKRDFFEPLAVTFKRVANITKEHAPEEVDEALFEADIERELYGEITRTAGAVDPLVEAKKFLGALERIAMQRGVVDRFFEEVLVMTDNAPVRNNRLNLLCGLSRQFLKIADFSKIVA